jgi:hypothetical protein
MADDNSGPIPYREGEPAPIGRMLAVDGRTGQRIWIDPSKVQRGEPPEDVLRQMGRSEPLGTLTPDQEERVRRLAWALRRDKPLPLDQWLHGFRRDMHPEQEIMLWEALAETLREEVSDRKPAKRERELLFAVLLQALNTPTLADLVSSMPSAKTLPNLERAYERLRSHWRSRTLPDGAPGAS